uniref:RRM domain-containing protein n=1 Tax=Chromera velia CCMP2878 TaxID=1169474 RepID=A0A0G4IC53_9ALVE|eukprot:Cvel_13049.t1-p1 / transcript=Cvel_13049.t1 / gene=Cvel_13049 / organism=Chromera_velia_CCMP2878 / gene_product=Cold-inducible RNA-binding protein, putative / transcript_product=Cold-inducible RNA-binding protein, putative / location=Cvel_scaffold878:10818-16990(-) / protein_length=1590 / sequence_SO=supercontig / SO=protein_coding / is_pseudo=false
MSSQRPQSGGRGGRRGGRGGSGFHHKNDQGGGRQKPPEWASQNADSIRQDGNFPLGEGGGDPLRSGGGRDRENGVKRGFVFPPPRNVSRGGFVFPPPRNVGCTVLPAGHDDGFIGDVGGGSGGHAGAHGHSHARDGPPGDYSRPGAGDSGNWGWVSDANPGGPGGGRQDWHHNHRGGRQEDPSGDPYRAPPASGDGGNWGWANQGGVDGREPSSFQQSPQSPHQQAAASSSRTTGRMQERVHVPPLDALAQAEERRKKHLIPNPYSIEFKNMKPLPELGGAPLSSPSGKSQLNASAPPYEHRQAAGNVYAWGEYHPEDRVPTSQLTQPQPQSGGGVVSRSVRDGGSRRGVSKTDRGDSIPEWARDDPHLTVGAGAGEDPYRQPRAPAHAGGGQAYEGGNFQHTDSHSHHPHAHGRPSSGKHKHRGDASQSLHGTARGDPRHTDRQMDSRGGPVGPGMPPHEGQSYGRRGADVRGPRGNERRDRAAEGVPPNDPPPHIPDNRPNDQPSYNPYGWGLMPGDRQGPSGGTPRDERPGRGTGGGQHWGDGKDVKGGHAGAQADDTWKGYTAPGQDYGHHAGAHRNDGHHAGARRDEWPSRRMGMPSDGVLIDNGREQSRMEDLWRDRDGEKEREGHYPYGGRDRQREREREGGDSGRYRGGGGGGYGGPEDPGRGARPREEWGVRGHFDDVYKVKLTSVPPQVTKQEMQEMLNQNVLHPEDVFLPLISNTNPSRNKGWCILEFGTRQEADRALRVQLKVGGRTLDTQWDTRDRPGGRDRERERRHDARRDLLPPREAGDGHGHQHETEHGDIEEDRARISSLPYNWHNEQLQDFLEKKGFSQIEDTYVCFDRGERTRNRGFGFVTFKKVEDVKRLMDMGKRGELEAEGRHMHVQQAFKRAGGDHGGRAPLSHSQREEHPPRERQQGDGKGRSREERGEGGWRRGAENEADGWGGNAKKAAGESKGGWGEVEKNGWGSGGKSGEDSGWGANDKGKGSASASVIPPPPPSAPPPQYAGPQYGTEAFNLMLTRLDYNTSRDALRRAVEAAGFRPLDVSLPPSKDPQYPGQNRGYGFVNFNTRGDAEAFLKKPFKVDGREIGVGWAKGSGDRKEGMKKEDKKEKESGKKETAGTRKERTQAPEKKTAASPTNPRVPQAQERHTTLTQPGGALTRTKAPPVKKADSFINLQYENRIGEECRELIRFSEGDDPLDLASKFLADFAEKSDPRVTQGVAAHLWNAIEQMGMRNLISPSAKDVRQTSTATPAAEAETAPKESSPDQPGEGEGEKSASSSSSSAEAAAVEVSAAIETDKPVDGEGEEEQDQEHPAMSPDSWVVLDAPDTFKEDESEALDATREDENVFPSVSSPDALAAAGDGLPPPPVSSSPAPISSPPPDTEKQSGASISPEPQRFSICDPEEDLRADVDEPDDLFQRGFEAFLGQSDTGTAPSQTLLHAGAPEDAGPAPPESLLYAGAAAEDLVGPLLGGGPVEPPADTEGEVEDAALQQQLVQGGAEEEGKVDHQPVVEEGGKEDGGEGAEGKETEKEHPGEGGKAVTLSAAEEEKDTATHCNENETGAMESNPSAEVVIESNGALVEDD